MSARGFWTDVTCAACGHIFMANTKDLAPEGCPSCGHVPTPGLIRAAADIAEAKRHLSNNDATLSTLRRERAAGK